MTTDELYNKVEDLLGMDAAWFVLPEPVPFHETDGWAVLDAEGDTLAVFPEKTIAEWVVAVLNEWVDIHWKDKP